MKTDKFFGALIIILFVLLGLVYAQFLQQGQMAGKNIQLLEQKVDGFEFILKKINSEVKSHVETVKNIDAKVSASDIERKDLASKIETLSKEIQTLQEDVKNLKASKEVKVSVTPAPEPSSKSVLVSEPTVAAPPETASEPEQPAATEEQPSTTAEQPAQQ